MLIQDQKQIFLEFHVAEAVRMQWYSSYFMKNVRKDEIRQYIVIRWFEKVLYCPKLGINYI